MSAAGQYLLFWIDSSGTTQRRYLPTLHKMRYYAKRECVYFSDRLRYAVWTGKKYERFVLIGGQVVTKSKLLSLLETLND